MIGKRVLITGSNGMLGSQLVKKFQNSIGFSSQELDITSKAQVRNVINYIKPKIIIHTAAFTDVDACENEVDKAYIVNTNGTGNLVNYCKNKDILFIFISSTGVYGSTKLTPYDEFDEVRPTTIHHKTKYEAEKIIMNNLNKYLILRTGWMFGGEIQHKKNFVYQRFLEGTKNNILYSNARQIGNPTYVDDLAKQIQVLINEDQLGLFNCVNEAKSISRYDYVKKIINCFELDCKLRKAPKDFFHRAAPVSNNESATNLKLDLLKINCMRSWDAALSEYINKLKNNLYN